MTLPIASQLLIVLALLLAIGSGPAGYIVFALAVIIAVLGAVTT